MANVREMNISLLDWETRAVLEAVSREAHRLKHKAATAVDEDEAADASNDYLELLSLQERLTKEATVIFGEQINNFSSQKI
ncbi:MAG: hypothetical protein RL497_1446 [Pseudomonadota bacterium]|jgi:hypothetical protein